jgi:hypothetical protein
MQSASFPRAPRDLIVKSSIAAASDKRLSTGNSQNGGASAPRFLCCRRVPDEPVEHATAKIGISSALGCDRAALTDHFLATFASLRYM